MTFLKKLGQVLAKSLTIAGEVTGLFPFIQPLLGSGKAAQVTGTVVNDFNAMLQQVTTIETALQGKPGTEKLTAAIPLISNVIKTSEAVAGKKIANEALFTQACQEFTQATVDLINSIDQSEVKTS